MSTTLLDLAAEYLLALFALAHADIPARNTLERYMPSWKDSGSLFAAIRVAKALRVAVGQAPGLAVRQRAGEALLKGSSDTVRGGEHNGGSREDGEDGNEVHSSRCIKKREGWSRRRRN
jgi:hypothetical protein